MKPWLMSYAQWVAMLVEQVTGLAYTPPNIPDNEPDDHLWQFTGRR